MSVAMASNIKTVFVRLLDEGTDVMRPVPALAISNVVYQLMEVANYDPEDETWEFLPGSRVICEMRDPNDKAYLLAIAIAVD